MRRKEETKWGKGYCHDRAKKDGHHHGYSYCPEMGDKSCKEDRDDMGSRKERIRNKVSKSQQDISDSAIFYVHSTNYSLAKNVRNLISSIFKDITLHYLKIYNIFAHALTF